MYIKILINEFKLDLEIKNYSKRTIKAYYNNNILLSNWLENTYNLKEIEDISHLHIREFIRHLQQKKLEMTYVNNLIRCFRAFFKYCVEEEYLTLNPMDKVSFVKQRRVLIETLQDEEVAKMLRYYTKKNDFYNIRNRTILMMFLDTGIRCSELCNLDNIDINETKTTIKIKEAKGNKQRRVPISPMLRKQMMKWERCRDSYFADRLPKDDGYFLSYRYKKLTIEAVERVVRIAGVETKLRKEIRCSPHTLRHTYAQMQLKNGLDVYSLSRLLGHSTIATTKQYLQGLQDDEIVEMSVKTSPLMNLKQNY